jgi:hypothetical protein
MAKKETTIAERSVLEKIGELIAEIRTKRAEVRRLDAESAELAATDTERSIDVDQRARAVERFIERRKLVIEDLIRERHAQQFAERDADIEALLWKRIHDAEDLAERLAAAVDVFTQAADALAAIGARSENAPFMSGRDLISSISAAAAMKAKIRSGLAFRKDSLARGAGVLRRAARDPSYYPTNASDGMSFVELRDCLPPFALDSFTVEEDPEAAPALVDAATN